VYPDARRLARDNRAFLTRAVRFAARSGIRQFVDIGSGLPTSPNVHEVARDTAPDARVAYVDHDPEVLSHARRMLAGDSGVTAVEGDMRSPEGIISDPGVRGVIDFGAPVGVLLVSVLRFVTVGEAAAIVGAFASRMAVNSYLVISAGASEDPDLTARFQAAYTAAPLHSHRPAADRLLVRGLRPGAAWPDRRPGMAAGRAAGTGTGGSARAPGAATILAGVGRKRDRGPDCGGADR
jgi:hypothetical protein